VFVAAAGVAGLAALALGMWLGGNLTQSQINGLAIGGTGDFTGWGLAASKLVMDLSSIGVVGLLLTRLLLPEGDPQTSATARRCLRTAAQIALAWGVSSAALLLFNWSNVVAVPVTELPIGKLFADTARTFPDAAEFVATTALALVIAAGLFLTQTRLGALIMLPLSIYNLVPMALQGHAAHGGVLRYSLLVHVVAMSLWVGGLAALLTHVRKEPTLLAVAVPRFSALALGCYAAVAASGIVAAWNLLGSVSAAWGSRYGILVMLKAAALITLGILGWWHRRHSVRRIRTGEGIRSRQAFIRLAAAEVVVMVAAVALAVALSRSAAPDTILLHSNREPTIPSPSTT
jgi:putative copper resistance protein D